MNIRDFLNKIFEKAGSKLIRKRDFCVFYPLLYRLLKQKSILRYVQIGANDGVYNDPVYPLLKEFPNKFEGVAVEPVPYHYEELCKNLSKYTQIKKICCAVHEKESEMDFYTIPPKFLKGKPEFFKGTSSFFSDNHCDKEKIKVKCKPFIEIIKEQQFENFDVLITDCEGYDHEIIINLDFSLIKPSLIYFEHGLSGGFMTFEQIQKVIKKLNGNGYQTILLDYDAISYDPLVFTKIFMENSKF